MYVVFKCRGCGRYLYVDEGVGVRRCPSCGVLNRLGEVKIVKLVENVKEAGKVVRSLQEKETGFIRGYDLLNIR
jgi:DNA-directed RNA polymerase subunit M/transcription elongation factor TFIIS